MKRGRFRYGRLLAGLLASAVLSFSPAGRSAIVTWVGVDASFWDLATNWSTNPAFPGAADDVALGAFNTTFRAASGTLTIQSFTGTGALTVTGGTLSFANASSIGALSMTGGALGGAGTLTVAGASTWSAGTQTGAGVTTFNDTLALSGTGAGLRARAPRGGAGHG